MAEPYGPSPLAKALAALQAELPTIHKDQTAEVEMKSGGKYSYTYADLASISAEVLPLLGKHGLSFIAKPTMRGNGFVLAYSLLHEGGEREDGEYPLPSNATPQNLGSAITYGRRYCLCAVTGVATADDDDDARKAAEKQERAADTAAAVGRQQAAAEEEAQAEMQHAVDSVVAEWTRTFGRYDVAQVASFYARWSLGQNLREAPAGQLRRFAAYLSAIPASEAGADPERFRIEHAEPAEEQLPPDKPRRVKTPGAITGPQRGRVFAELNGRGFRDDNDQRDELSQILGRVITSRKELTFEDGQVLIDYFESHPTSGPPGVGGPDDGPGVQGGSVEPKPPPAPGAAPGPSSPTSKEGQ